MEYFNFANEKYIPDYYEPEIYKLNSEDDYSDAIQVIFNSPNGIDSDGYIRIYLDDGMYYSPYDSDDNDWLICLFIPIISSKD